MRRWSKNIVVFTLLFLFTFGIWCASLAAAASLTVALQEEGLQPGCGSPSSPSPLGKMDHHQPKVICPFEFVRGLSPELLISSPTRDFTKGGRIQVTKGFPPTVGQESLLSSRDIASISQAISTPKVSIHLFHSVLTL